LYPVGCTKPVEQPVVQQSLYNRQLVEQLTVSTTGLRTGWMFVKTMQPVVQPVWQPVNRVLQWQLQLTKSK